MTNSLELTFLRITQALAYLGGVILVLLTVLTVYSIVGRTIVKTDWLGAVPFLDWWRPIRGDFELIEIGTGIAIFSFLPYCQMVRGNVLVDFFTNRASPRIKAALAALSNLLYSLLSILITWRMVVGSEDFYTATFKQSSMILKIPIWQAMFVSTALMVVLSAVCLFTLYRSLREMVGQGEAEGAVAS